jgi:methionyl-tRNA formyltransferase
VTDVLFLGHLDSPLIGYLRNHGCGVASTDSAVVASHLGNFDFLVSFGYRYILKKDVLDRFPDAAVNCHLSLLPWNRGADPNYWSFADCSPSGVTIHFMNEGLDKGDIIAQRRIEFSDHPCNTLGSTYEVLEAHLIDLFMDWWPTIQSRQVLRRPQTGPGSYHCLGQMPPLPLRWNTPITEIRKS